jgi:hypothetical protein
MEEGCGRKTILMDTIQKIAIRKEDLIQALNNSFVEISRATQDAIEI